MAKSIKLKDSTYLDSSSVVFNQTLLSTLLDILRIYPLKSYSSMTNFLTAYSNFASQKLHVGYAIIENANSLFIGFNQKYQNQGYARVIILNAWHSYIAYASGGAWTVKEISTN